MPGEPTDDFEGLSPGEAALLRDAAKAQRYQEMRERGRQIGGVPGAMVAGLMIALRDIYDPPPKRGRRHPDGRGTRRSPRCRS